MVVSFGHDENGKYSGGKAGDQKGDEGRIRPYYIYSNGGWDCVLRYPKREVGQKIAKKARNAAKNDNIGYDQSNRLSFYTALSKVKWRVVDIKEKVETDCSASTMAVIIASGMTLKVKKLQQLSPALTTWGIRAALKAVGFQVLTDKKYLTSDDNLLEGDIILNESHHVIVNVTDGKNAKKELASISK